jgi:hypothetical protein
MPTKEIPYNIGSINVLGGQAGFKLDFLRGVRRPSMPHAMHDVVDNVR